MKIQHKFLALIEMTSKIKNRPIHTDFKSRLLLKEQGIIDLFIELRDFILSIHLDSNELLYHTHALTSVYSISEKLSDAYCHIPIYNNHLNLGFNKGTLIEDPDKLLKGTGKFIRHIPITTIEDLKNKKVEAIINRAIKFAKDDMDKEPKLIGQTISKIKTRN